MTNKADRLQRRLALNGDLHLMRRIKVKINWKKLGIGVALAGALLITASVVFSHEHQEPQGPPRGGGFRGERGPGDGLGPLGRDLNLTDEQKAQIKKIQDGFRESDRALMAQLRTLHQSESDPMSGNFDEAA